MLPAMQSPAALQPCLIALMALPISATLAVGLQRVGNTMTPVEAFTVQLS